MPRELLLDRLPLPDPARPHVRWSQLHGSGLSLAAAEAAARHGGTVCVIAPSAAAADRIERGLEFFGGAPVRRFPSYETLPYEPISPPQDLLADRLLCLYQLARGERLTLVVEAGALLDRLPPREFVVSRSLQLTVGDKLEHGAMIRTLTEHGYLRVEQVAEPGEFAVRGAVLDVFATGGVQPVRIDLFDEEIESLRMFDAQTQLSSGKTDALRRYHGVFAAASAWRAAITPAGRGRGARHKAALQPSSERPVSKHAALTWMQRLKRVFAIEIERGDL